VSDAAFDEDARFTLGVLPLVNEVFAKVKAMLPPDTHFGVFILTPPHEGEGRVIAATTDRKIVGPQVAQWYLSTHAAAASTQGES
jgi:hypothetical protein